MNLETKLSPQLWEVIRSNVESRNWKSAVLDAIHFLTDIIRERSGLDGDGVPLVGQAFGGIAPKLKVNRMQTDSEVNVQRGTEAMLRGLYLAIRNPRSHEQYQENDRDAEAIILFIDYLLRVVDQSKTPFSLQSFVARVVDPDFVPNSHYSALLVKKIPAGKRLAVCRELFSRRADVDRDNARFFYSTILDQLSETEIVEFAELVSEELSQTDDDDTIRFVLRGLPSSLWVQLDDIARIRIENKLIKSVKSGIVRKRECFAGGLGTWISSILKHLTLKDDLWREVFAKLGSVDRGEQEYVFNYFIHYVEDSFEVPPPTLIRHFIKGLKAGDVRFQRQAKAWANEGLELRGPEHPWRKPFARDLEEFVETIERFETPLVDDDIPF